MKHATILMLAGILTAIPSVGVAQNQRELDVRRDLARFADDDSWYYNDLESGLAKARRSAQPLLVIFRCVP
jgi:hypothetical protein